MNYIIDLTDSNAKSCRIKLMLPSLIGNADSTTSSWYVLDEGFFKYRSGFCGASANAPGWENTKWGAPLMDVLLYVKAGFPGILLSDFTSFISPVNSTGKGKIMQSDWCVNFANGEFTWVLIG